MFSGHGATVMTAGADPDPRTTERLPERLKYQDSSSTILEASEGCSIPQLIRRHAPLRARHSSRMTLAGLSASGTEKPE
jgi:hypothetical protein